MNRINIFSKIRANIIESIHHIPSDLARIITEYAIQSASNYLMDLIRANPKHAKYFELNLGDFSYSLRLMDIYIHGIDVTLYRKTGRRSKILCACIVSGDTIISFAYRPSDFLRIASTGDGAHWFASQQSLPCRLLALIGDHAYSFAAQIKNALNKAIFGASLGVESMIPDWEPSQ